RLDSSASRGVRFRCLSLLIPIQLRLCAAAIALHLPHQGIGRGEIMIKSNTWLSARNVMLATLTVAATLGAATTAPARDDDEKDRGKHYGRSKNNNDERGEWRERQQRHEAWLREQERRERR